MTFDITKVCYKAREELLGEEVYFAQSLPALEEIVATENGVYKGCVTKLDKVGSTMPFCIGNGMWANYIYPTGKKKETVPPEPKYRPFENIDELIERWNFLNPCTRPNYTMPLIWVRYKGLGNDAHTPTVQLITAFSDLGVEMGAEFMTWDCLFERMEFLDGTLCGVEVC